MKLKPTHNRVCLLVFVSLITVSSRLFAQPGANFTANPVTGCSPIVVSFQDQSTGNPTQWRWQLGNGVTSYLQNPSATYFNPGTYNVKLVVSNATGTDSIVRNQFITVYANPVVNFRASDSAGCFPLYVQFTDLSNPVNGTISSWNWDFGDGTTSALANPSHTYTDAGNFSVTLKVTNSFGCTKTFSKTQYIQVSSGVSADFSNTSAGQCAAPVTIHFTNLSTGPGPLSYSWDFGDASGSVLADPVHTYTNPGSYTVRLVTASPRGCVDTIVKVNLISIGTVNSQFTSPPGACVGEAIAITNTTTPSPGAVQWYFGDGTTSTDINPVKSYSVAGTYTIKLVNDFGGCKDSVNRSIIINPKPAAAFSAGTTTACKLPFTVNFQNQTAGNNSYQWQFGDGATSPVTNPAHIYTVAGEYSVTLIVTNPNGCADTFTRQQYIKIQEPSTEVFGLPMTGCLPLTIQPTATVTANEPVATYLWDFGDGTTSNAILPSHTYNTAGNYNVRLIITTIGGCTDTVTIINAVKTGNKPNANFSLNPTDVCAFQPIQFADHSSGNVDEWLWQFGDGGSSVIQNPDYAYQDTGYFSVTLVVWSNTCADTLRLDNIVHIKPPIARFTVDANCINKFDRDFVDQSVGANTWQWSFGDGNSSALQNPSHTYGSPGAYTVTLVVSNGTCTHTTAQTIRVVDETANFAANNDTVCKNSPVNFTAVNINAANISGWEWDFGDGASAATPLSASHAFTAAGSYTVRLIITDILGCTDTTTHPIQVHGPTASFTSNVQSACIGNSAIQFTDASATDGVHPIVQRIWNYGDGTIDSSGQAPYTHLYATAGSYTVSLTVTDNYGCSDNFSMPAAMVISKPRADFNSPDTNSCADKPIRFNNSSEGYDLQYSWQFGDGLQDTIINPIHQYSNVGLYSVSLQVTDRYGCKDSVMRSGYINISMPKALFTVSDSVSTCPPMLVNFTNSSLYYTSLTWDFGDGNTSTLNNPFHHYTVPGIFYAKLMVAGPGGCTDTMVKRIEVRGPRGSFSYLPGSGCNPLTVTFTATTLNRTSFIWDFSDGNTIASADSVISHTYTSPGDYIPKMILLDASGCSLPVIGSDTIRVMDIDARFSLDAYRFCDSGYVNFRDQSVSNDLITGYLWNFGDGNSSNARDPVHHYISPGIYSVQLKVFSQGGCVDSVQLADTIRIIESPVINIVGDNEACVPAELSFAGQVIRGDMNTMHWKWIFGNGQGALIQFPSPQTYTIAANYTVTSIATDNNGCKDSVSKALSIHPVPNTNAGADGKLCKGNSIQLRATGATNYIWDASPSLSCIECDNPLASPVDTSLYIVTGYSQFGCSRRDSVYITVKQPFALLVTPDDSVCAGGSVNLSARGADRYQWSPSTGLDNPTNATTRATPGVTTLYKVIASDNENCFTDTAAVLVTVFPFPTVEAGPDISISAGTPGQLEATGSGDIVSWNWTPQYQLSCYNCRDPKAFPKQTTTYTVQVKNAGGCITRDNMTVSVLCDNSNLFIPNTFSPNDDGMNDKFYPRGKGLGLIRSLRVYNRWGEIVFEKTSFNANDAAAGWDGTYKGKRLSPDVFVYTCEVICENNTVLLFKGDITLIR